MGDDPDVYARLAWALRDRKGRLRLTISGTPFLYLTRKSARQAVRYSGGPWTPARVRVSVELAARTPGGSDQ